MSKDFSYTLHRTLDAPVAKVWEAWTSPDQYAHWANAVPGSVSLDVRPGGAWKATMKTPDGQEFPLTGSYSEVVENQRLVIGMDVPGRAEQSLMEVDLAPEGDGSRITVTQAADTAEERDMAQEGTNFLFDGLAGFLAKGEG